MASNTLARVLEPRFHKPPVSLKRWLSGSIPQLQSIRGQALVPKDAKDQTRVNPLGIQLLSHSLHQQVFPHPTFPDVRETDVQVARHNLRRTGLLANKPHVQPTIDLELPKMLGEDIDQHFHNIGVEQSEPWLSFAETYAETPTLSLPDEFPIKSGWSKYDPTDRTWSSVPYPKDESMLTFDVEVLYKIHSYPVIATACSPTAWYSWISPWLLKESDSPQHLIPFGPVNQARLIVGHNVGYDRARIKEEYTLKGTKNRFLDTMSLHAASQGVSAPQRGLWKKHWSQNEMMLRKQKELVAAIEKLKERMAAGEEEELVTDVEVLDGSALFLDTPSDKPIQIVQKLSESLVLLEYELASLPILPSPRKDLSLNHFGEAGEATSEHHDWADVTSMNALDQVFKLHFPDEEQTIDKTQRAAFSTTDPDSIVRNLPALLRYCALDVHSTHRVFSKAFPRFRRLCPSPISFAGPLSMGSSFLPINKNWSSYITNAEATWVDLDQKVKRSLALLAEAARKKWKEPEAGWTAHKEIGWDEEVRLACPEEVRDDPWLSQLDWTPKQAKHFRWKTQLEKSLTEDDLKRNGEWLGVEGEDSVAAATTASGGKGRRKRILFGDTMPTDSIELAKSKHLPRLLGLTFNGDAIHYSHQHGFVYQTSLSTHPPPAEPPLSFTHSKDRYFIKQAASGVGFCTILKGKKLMRLLSPNSLMLPKLKEGLGSGSSERELLGAIRQERGWGFVKEKLVDILKKRGVDAVVRNASPPAVDSPEALCQPIFEFGQPRTTKDLSDVFIPPSKSALQARWWPTWYWTLFDPQPGRPLNNMQLTARGQTSTHLLRLSWDGHPLYRSAEFGWVYRVSGRRAILQADPQAKSALAFEQGRLALAQIRRGESAGEFKEKGGKSRVALNPDIALYEQTFIRDVIFLKIPHPEGDAHRVGKILSKGLSKHLENETLTSEYVLAKQAIDMDMSCSYWISVRDRVKEQMVVKRADELDMGLPAELGNDLDFGMILPQVVVMGAITRRAVEKTWLTASNPKSDRVGSELKAMVQAPPGYSIVGADVDSEELWIASLLGDAQLGIHGGTPIGWMTLEGTKAEGTDVHSKTASIVNVSREGAKIFNYSRIYGAGIRHTTQLLMEGQSVQDEKEASNAAKLLYASTKGIHVDYSNRDLHRFWFGGTESYLFNSMENLARSKRPQTPALHCGITAALREEYLDDPDDHLPSRINWVVQSSGVDYLHLLIVSMNYLSALYNIDAKYLISVHDEVRYLVKDEDRYRASLALQIANLWTRSLFAYKCGMEDLPQSCAFFSAVDIDSVLRKEVDTPCVTPSNPTPIPPGEALQITEIIERTKGSLHSDGQSMTQPPPPATSLPTPIPLTARPYHPKAGLKPNTPESRTRWKDFFIHAQACASQTELIRVWHEFGRPGDPRMAKKASASGGWVAHPSSFSRSYSSKGDSPFDRPNPSESCPPVLVDKPFPHYRRPNKYELGVLESTLDPHNTSSPPTQQAPLTFRKPS